MSPRTPVDVIIEQQQEQIRLLRERLEHQGKQHTSDAMEFHRTIRQLETRIRELERERGDA